MDGQRFDQFVRLIAASDGSRRRLVRQLTGSAIGAAALAGLSAEEAAAKRCETPSDCPRRSTCCDRKCVDISADEKHCGGCRRRCRGNKTCCGGKCRDVKRDRNNCGRCRRRCRRDEACERGKCAKTTTSCSPPEPVRCPLGSVKACCRADGLGEWECCEQGAKKPCCPPGDPVCCPPGTGGLVDCCRPVGATCCPGRDRGAGHFLLPAGHRLLREPARLPVARSPREGAGNRDAAGDRALILAIRRHRRRGKGAEHSLEPPPRTFPLRGGAATARGPSPARASTCPIACQNGVAPAAGGVDSSHPV